MTSRDELARAVAQSLGLSQDKFGNWITNGHTIPKPIVEALIDAEMRVQQANEEIANLRAEDDGDLRIHDKLQMAEECIENWTKRCEQAEHKAELRVQELREALENFMPQVEELHSQTSDCGIRQCDCPMAQMWRKANSLIGAGLSKESK